MASERIALVLQGGAGPISPEVYIRNQGALREHMDVLVPMLQGGASAMDVVEEAVARMETDPRFNAGIGSSMRLDRSIQLDASIMDGARLRGAGVAAVTRLVNPVRLARQVLERTPHVLLVGPWADAFADECGFERVPTEALIVPERLALWERKMKARETSADQLLSSGGTVGAVALDADGGLAAATSTGGMVLSMPGRVGDSAILGAGTYATPAAAVSVTGVGESIMLTLMAKHCADLIAAGAAPHDACEACVKYQRDTTPGTSGLVAVSADGAIGLAFNSIEMNRASFTPTSGLLVP